MPWTSPVSGDYADPNRFSQRVHGYCYRIWGGYGKPLVAKASLPVVLAGAQILALGQGAQ
ncbi:MAG: hypothetical protein ACP5Q0_01855 [Halothiobacillus sp.]